MSDEPNVPEVYRWVEARLDMDYVREVAASVAAALREGVPIGAVLQPGDGTRYDFAFLPTQGLRHAPARVVRGESWGNVTDFGISRDPGTALVSWYRHGAAGFDLRSGGFEPLYLDECFADCGLGSACTVALFFNAVADVFPTLDEKGTT